MNTKISWDWANGILYRMCEKSPRHTDKEVIAGKMWLIGRAYAAQIERGAGEAGNSNAIYARVAEKIAASDLDRWLESVSDVKRVDTSNLHRVLEVQKNLIDLLEESTCRKRHSFASKYLHFHNAYAFFIYDSDASVEIRRRVGRRHFSLPPACLKFDPDYAGFVIRCIEYRDREPENHNMTPRQLDQELLAY